MKKSQFKLEFIKNRMMNYGFYINIISFILSYILPTMFGTFGFSLDFLTLKDSIRERRKSNKEKTQNND